MPSFSKQIRINVTPEDKDIYQKFCQREHYTESQAGWWAIKRFMQDHDPETFRGAVNEVLGAKGLGFFLEKFNQKKEDD